MKLPCEGMSRYCVLALHVERPAPQAGSEEAQRSLTDRSVRVHKTVPEEPPQQPAPAATAAAVRLTEEWSKESNTTDS